MLGLYSGIQEQCEGYYVMMKRKIYNRTGARSIICLGSLRRTNWSMLQHPQENPRLGMLGTPKGQISRKPSDASEARICGGSKRCDAPLLSASKPDTRPAIRLVPSQLSMLYAASREDEWSKHPRRRQSYLRRSVADDDIPGHTCKHDIPRE